MPRDSHANDLWAWETTISTSSVAEFDRELRSARADFVSSGVIALIDSTLGFNIGFLVRDPDGHVLRVIQP